MSHHPIDGLTLRQTVLVEEISDETLEELHFRQAYVAGIATLLQTALQTINPNLTTHTYPRHTGSHTIDRSIDITLPPGYQDPISRLHLAYHPDIQAHVVYDYTKLIIAIRPNPGNPDSVDITLPLETPDLLAQLTHIAKSYSETLLRHASPLLLTPRVQNDS